MDNTRYYAVYDVDGTLLSIGTIDSGEPLKGEITKEEYDALYAEIIANQPSEEELPDPETEEALAILRGEVTE